MELKTKTNGVFYLEVRLPDTNGDLRRFRVSIDTRDKCAAVVSVQSDLIDGA